MSSVAVDAEGHTILFFDLCQFGGLIILMDILRLGCDGAWRRERFLQLSSRWQSRPSFEMVHEIFGMWSGGVDEQAFSSNEGRRPFY
jgi:hypothetical protein